MNPKYKLSQILLFGFMLSACNLDEIISKAQEECSNSSCEERLNTDSNENDSATDNSEEEQSSSSSTLYSNAFDVDGPLENEWLGLDMFGPPPLPEITGGNLVNTQGSGAITARLSNLTLQNYYFEFEFIPNDQSVLGFPIRYDNTISEFFFCLFMPASGNYTLRIGRVYNDGSEYNVIDLTDALADPTATQPLKAGCSVETSGDDVIVKAYLDPENNSAPVLQQTFSGYNTTLPEGNPALYFPVPGSAIGSYSIYSTIPY